MSQKPNAMQRVNVNLPADVRLRLRALAKHSRMRDGELARELLLDALVVRDVADRLYDGDPLVVEVSARESGTKRSQVILLAHILSVRKDRFQAEPVGALKPETLARVANGLERIFDL
jgi:hypothetical protein